MTTITIEAAYQYATAHRQAGRLVEAETLLRQIVAAAPGLTDAWHQLGLVVLTTRRPAEAVELLARAVAGAPGSAHYHSDLGVAFSYCGRREEAIGAFQRALALRPDLAHTRRNLGDVLYGQGRNEEAIATYRETLAMAPEDAHAHNNLGSVLQKTGRLEEALACYERAAQLAPGLLEAQSNYGDALTKVGRLEEGLACSRRVLALNPQFPDGYLNMGVAWCLRGSFAEAEVCFRQAIALRPDFANAHLDLSLLLLLLGRYEEGWHEYEWRWRSPAHAFRHRHFSVPLWDGKPAPGRTILIHAEQGFGDTLLFTRFLPLVRARSQAARVIFECPPAVIPLLARLLGPEIVLVARGETDAGLPPFDLHLPMFSMPLALQCFAPLPPMAPCAPLDAGLRAQWRERIGGGAGLRVGVAWAGNPAQEEDRRRSIPIEKLGPILQVSGARFFSLQVYGNESLIPIFNSGVVDYSEKIGNFDDSSSFMAELDLVITVDTATAHLAGTLGRPVWVLVPLMPYWPYQLGGEETPWYPTMRMFRQQAPGEWGEVIERVAAALRQELA